jgi:hypothetical protein
MDLVHLKSAFPQLRGIEKAAPREFPDQPGWYILAYGQGFVSDDRARGPTFEKDGCSLSVQAKFPAARDEASARPIIGHAFPTTNGQFAVVWSLVTAESTAAGQSFVDKAEEIIQSRLRMLEKDLLAAE